MTRDSKISKRLVGLFLLGCALFNFPLLSLFNLDMIVWGIPLLCWYIFGTWGLLIGMCVLVTRIQPGPLEDEREHKPSLSDIFHRFVLKTKGSITPFNSTIDKSQIPNTTF